MRESKSENKDKLEVFLEKGFTIIELLVTTSIFLIATTAVLVNYPRANTRIALSILAQDIALSLREAQVFGTAIREVRPGTREFPDYGMYFNEKKNDEYVLFADLDKNSAFDTRSTCSALATSVQGECLQTFLITSRNRISLLCRDLSKENSRAGKIFPDKSDCVGSNRLSSLVILFHRPNPEAILRAVAFDGTTIAEVITDAEVFLTSPEGEERTVIIWNTGQISVK